MGQLLACGVEVATEKSGHQFVQLAPNMCITPAAPSPLPMPYPILGDTKNLDPGCNDVLHTGKKTMNTKGKIKALKGNEAGTQKDIVTMKTGGTAWAVVGVPVVMFEGAMVVMTGAPGFGNCM